MEGTAQQCETRCFNIFASPGYFYAPAIVRSAEEYKTLIGVIGGDSIEAWTGLLFNRNTETLTSKYDSTFSATRAFGNTLPESYGAYQRLLNNTVALLLPDNGNDQLAVFFQNGSYRAVNQRFSGPKCACSLEIRPGEIITFFSFSSCFFPLITSQANV